MAANQFSCQFKLLLEKGTHSDVTFLVGEEQIAVPAHKAILSARLVNGILTTQNRKELIVRGVSSP